MSTLGQPRTPGKPHRWSNPDADGVRACNNDGCTLRTADSFRMWQQKKGARWQRWDRALFPECNGKAPASPAAPRMLGRICMKCGDPFSGPVEPTLPHCPRCAEGCAGCPPEARDSAPAVEESVPRTASLGAVLASGLPPIRPDRAIPSTQPNPAPVERIRTLVTVLCTTRSPTAERELAAALSALERALPEFMDGHHALKRIQNKGGHLTLTSQDCPECTATLEGRE